MALTKQLQLRAFITKTCEGQLLSETQEDVSASFRIKVFKVEASKPLSCAFVEMNGNGIALMRNYTFQADLGDAAANHIKQAYEYLKTLPEFAGAVDC
jgi:hypothetical protein